MVQKLRKTCFKAWSRPRALASSFPGGGGFSETGLPRLFLRESAPKDRGAGLNPHERARNGRARNGRDRNGRARNERDRICTDPVNAVDRGWVLSFRRQGKPQPKLGKRRWLNLIFASRNCMVIVLWERLRTGIAAPTEPLASGLRKFLFALASAAAYPACKIRQSCSSAPTSPPPLPVLQATLPALPRKIRSRCRPAELG